MVKTSKPTILHLTVDQLHRSDLNVRKKPSSAASDAEVSASLLASPQGLCARQRFGRHNANIG
ncbi:MAG: hypothetical protein J0H88_24240 [Sphingomonadales bacterium]|nr:hypothetical protein [Sphingomonadales bacterium]